MHALPLAVWHDRSRVKLADALDDRASFRRCCGFAYTEQMPERIAFVRFRRELLRHDIDQVFLNAITVQLKAKAIRNTIGTMIGPSFA